MVGGKVWAYLNEQWTKGPLHMTLLDPATSAGDEGARIAARAAELGTHAIMVGGSTGVTAENLDALVAGVKKRTNLPVVYFPSSAGAMSRHVDAVYFLSALNSRNPRVLVREQARGAPALKALGLETLGMGYVIVEPGMRVGEVSEVDVVPRTDAGIEEAVGYALAAEAFGMPLVYLEAGSGAPDPVPARMVKAVRAQLGARLMVGGGIRTAEQAADLLGAGADVIVTGTIAEHGAFERLEGIIRAVQARRND